MKNGLMINSNGDKCWYKNGKSHREDGPAIEYSNGTKSWHKEGKLHRDNGPAVEWITGEKHWYKEGKEIDCNSTEEFVKLLKLKVFW